MCLACRLVGVAEPSEEDSTGGFSVRSIYISHHSHCGMLYRTGECAFVKLNGIQQQHLGCMKITSIFSFKIHEVYHNFIRNSPKQWKSYSFRDQQLSNGVGSRYIKKSDAVPTDNEWVVIDYEQTTLPLCPEVYQFLSILNKVTVLVRGEGNETWLAHVHSCNEISKLCLVYLYIIIIPVQENPKLYHEERHKLEKYNGIVSQDMHKDSGRMKHSIYQNQLQITKQFFFNKIYLLNIANYVCIPEVFWH